MNVEWLQEFCNIWYTNIHWKIFPQYKKEENEVSFFLINTILTFVEIKSNVYRNAYYSEGYS